MEPDDRRERALALLESQHTFPGPFDFRVVTRPADRGILRGITRTVLIEAINGQGLQFEERPFTLEEAFQAQEAFITAASQIVMPVVRVDGRSIGDGSPGPVARMLRRVFHAHAEWV